MHAQFVQSGPCLPQGSGKDGEVDCTSAIVVRELHMVSAVRGGFRFHVTKMQQTFGKLETGAAPATYLLPKGRGGGS